MTLAEILAKIGIVKNETITDANTASRVGQALEDLANYIPTTNETNASIAKIINDSSDQGATAPADTDMIPLGKGSSLKGWKILDFRNWMAIIFASKTEADIYNVTVKIPLTSGQYYTISSAITAIPVALQKKNLSISFEYESGKWTTLKFKGNLISNFSDLKYWERTGADISEKNLKSFLTIYKLEVNGASVSSDGILTIPSGSSGYGARVGFEVPSNIRNLRARVISNIAIPSCALFYTTDGGLTFTTIPISSLSIAKPDGTFHHEFEILIPTLNAARIFVQSGLNTAFLTLTTLQFDKIISKDSSIDSRILDSETRISTSEIKISLQDSRLSGVESRLAINESALGDTYLGILVGENLGGSISITNGFSIPTGQTGNQSYRVIKKTTYDMSKLYVGQLIRYEFDLTITNYTLLSGSFSYKLQQSSNAGLTYIQQVLYDSYNLKETIITTTKVIHFTGFKTINQLDVSSGYVYKAIFQLTNLTNLTSDISITVSNAYIYEGLLISDHIKSIESTLGAHSLQLSGIAIKNLYTCVFSTGEFLGGSISINNGFKIPIGQNGYQSYFRIIDSPFSYRVESYAGQIITMIIPIVIVNYTELTLITDHMTLRKLQGSATINSAVSPTSQSYNDSIVGTTLTRTFTLIYILTDSDISNRYFYDCYFMSFNTFVVTKEVSYTTSGFSFSRDDSVSHKFNVTDLRLALLENSGSILKSKTAKRYGIAGVDADFTGQFAIQAAIDSITDASSKNQYEIIFSGIFECLQVSDFKKGDLVGSGQKHFIEGKDYINLRGVGKDESIIKIHLPDTLGSTFAYSLYNGIMWNANANLSDFTIFGENCRYAIHIDGGQLTCKNFIQFIRNCRLYAKNTGDALVWSSYRPLGVGMSDGQSLTIEDCEIEGKQPIYYHTNKNFANPSKVTYRRTHLVQPDTLQEEAIALQPLGSRKRDLFVMDNCIIDWGHLSIGDQPWIPEALIDQKADHAEIEINMTSQVPMPVSTGYGSRGLKIISKTLGVNSTVIFDQMSSAFNLLIGDSNQAVEFTNKYNRKEIYGYQYKIGGASSGYAIGSLDIAQHTVGILNNKYVGALGKRLGDCSTVNKTLSIIIDGITYNVVFNKNYNGTLETIVPNYSNVQIIAEITAVIGTVATVIEYDVSRDYYPKFKGLKNMINGDTTEVYIGMGIIFLGIKTFRKALNSDGKIDGILLDYGEIGDKCRIITSGELWAKNQGNLFCTKEITSSLRSLGDKLGISTATPGVFDVSATPSLLICKRTNVLSFI